MLDIEVKEDGQVRLVGRLDASQADLAQKALARLKGPLVLDCGALDYISSAGIGVLVETYKRMVGAGSSLRIIRLTPRVRSVLALANLDRVLTLE